jgi:hypothetical protein
MSPRAFPAAGGPAPSTKHSATAMRPAQAIRPYSRQRDLPLANARYFRSAATVLDEPARSTFKLPETNT